MGTNSIDSSIVSMQGQTSPSIRQAITSKEGGAENKDITKNDKNLLVGPYQANINSTM